MCRTPPTFYGSQTSISTLQSLPFGIWTPNTTFTMPVVMMPMERILGAPSPPNPLKLPRARLAEKLAEIQNGKAPRPTNEVRETVGEIADELRV